jgi:hypothetical protein
MVRCAAIVTEVEEREAEQRHRSSGRMCFCLTDESTVACHTKITLKPCFMFDTIEAS